MYILYETDSRASPKETTVILFFIIILYTSRIYAPRYVDTIMYYTPSQVHVSLCSNISITYPCTVSCGMYDTYPQSYRPFNPCGQSKKIIYIFLLYNIAYISARLIRLSVANPICNKLCMQICYLRVGTYTFDDFYSIRRSLMEE